MKNNKFKDIFNTCLQLGLIVILFIILCGMIKERIDITHQFFQQQYDLAKAKANEYVEVSKQIEQGNYDCREIYNHSFSRRQVQDLVDKCLIYQNS